MLFTLGYAKRFLCSINLLGNTSNKTQNKREGDDKIAKFVQKVKKKKKGLKITNNTKQY